MVPVPVNTFSIGPFNPVYAPALEGDKGFFPGLVLWGGTTQLTQLTQNGRLASTGSLSNTQRTMEAVRQVSGQVLNKCEGVTF